jgi:GTPase SAR1 family protein
MVKTRFAYFAESLKICVTICRMPEINHYCPEAPFILCGNKTDLRADNDTLRRLAAKNNAPISFEQGQVLAKQVGALKYVECSARTGDGLRDVFDSAIRAVIKPEQKKKKSGNVKKCNLL